MNNEKMLPFRCHRGHQTLENPVIPGFWGILKLFPLDCCRWFGGNVIEDAVDVVHFVDDAARNLIQYLVRDACPVSSHKVGGGDTAQRHGVVIGTEVAHDADRTHIGQNSEILVDGFIQTCFGNLIAEDEICFAQDGQLFFGDFANDADGKTRTREGLAVDLTFGRSEF